MTYLIITLIFLCGCLPLPVPTNTVENVEDYPDQVNRAIVICLSDVNVTTNKDGTKLCADLSHEAWDAHIENRDINFNETEGEMP